jgi:hypothetical protein
MRIQQADGLFCRPSPTPGRQVLGPCIPVLARIFMFLPTFPTFLGMYVLIGRK